MVIFKNNEDLPQAVVSELLESCGYEVAKTPETLTVRLEDNLFGIHEAVEEIEGKLYIKLYELDDSVFESVKDSADPVAIVELDEVQYRLSKDAYEFEDEVYLALESTKEDEDEDEDFVPVLTINEEDFIVVEDEEDAEYVAYLSGNEEDGYELVDTEEEADVVAYLSDLEPEDEDKD